MPEEDTKHLEGPDLSQGMPQYIYTRKKYSRNAPPPRPKDTQSWRWNGSPDPVLVFRAPVVIEGREWLTEKDRTLLISKLLFEGAVFTTRRGFVPITEPNIGDTGWVNIVGSRRRRRVAFLDHQWIPFHPDPQ